MAFEIALLGRSGFDYAIPEEKYELSKHPEPIFRLTFNVPDVCRIQARCAGAGCRHGFGRTVS